MWRPLRRLAGWIKRLNYTTRAAIIASVLTVLGTALFTLIIHYMTKEKPKEVLLPVSISATRYYFPKIERFSKEQLQQMPEMTYLTVVYIPNDTGVPVFNMVVTVPKEGILEILDENNNSTVSNFKKRVEIPMIPGSSTRTLHMWHRDPLSEDDRITVTTLNSPARVWHGKDLLAAPTATYQRRLYYYYGFVALLALVIFGRDAWKWWWWRKAARAGSAPAPSTPPQTTQPG